MYIRLAPGSVIHEYCDMRNVGKARMNTNSNVRKAQSCLNARRLSLHAAMQSLKHNTHWIFRAVIACVLMGACVLAGCSAHPGSSAAQAGAKKTIYATFFPVADLARQIVGDHMTVETIIKGNQEPHDFELKAQDMAAMRNADLFMYNGAGMESFIDDLKHSIGDDSKFLDLSQGLTLLKTEHDEEPEEPEGDSAGNDEQLKELKAARKHAHNHEHELDGVNPHTWLSIRNAITELDTICKKVSQIDPEHADDYQKNYEAAVQRFKDLDAQFAETLSSVPKDRRYFIASHAAFNYLAKDYGLKQIAVTGISPEDEPTAEQLAKIADFVKEHKITTIFFEGKATPKVAETLARSTGAKTGTLYTMESLTDDEIQMGYLALMEKNLESLMESFK